MQTRFMRPALSRRQLLGGGGIALSLSLTGCGNTALDVIWDGWTGAHAAPPLTRAQIDALPQAAISARLGLGPATLFTASALDGEKLIWDAAEPVRLITAAGRIVGLYGTPSSLRGVQFVTTDPLARAPHHLDGPVGVARNLDWGHTRYDVLAVTGTMAPAGMETITIADVAIECLRLDETVRTQNGTRLNASFWVEAKTGLVWRSKQEVLPDLPAITIEVLKPAAVPGGVRV